MEASNKIFVLNWDCMSLVDPSRDCRTLNHRLEIFRIVTPFDSDLKVECILHSSHSLVSINVHGTISVRSSEGSCALDIRTQRFPYCFPRKLECLVPKISKVTGISRLPSGCICIRYDMINLGLYL